MTPNFCRVCWRPLGHLDAFDKDVQRRVAAVARFRRHRGDGPAEIVADDEHVAGEIGDRVGARVGDLALGAATEILISASVRRSRSFRSPTPKEGCEARARLTYRTAKIKGAAHHRANANYAELGAENADLALKRRLGNRIRLMRKAVSIKKGRSKAERPKSREETPKLGSDCEEACHRNRISDDGLLRACSAISTSIS